MDTAAMQGLADALKKLVIPSSANAVSVKLPSLWTDNPTLWFARAEAQFEAASITRDDTKFNHVVSVLDNATASEISSLLTEPPATEKYPAIKSALIKVYGKPQEVKDSELLNIAGLGDRKPSGLLRHMHVVPKANGESRPCGDYRRLNDATTPDRYPVPNIQDFSHNLDGKSVFSKVDLVKGYFQIPVRPQDVAKTAITTPFGLFEFLRMPFGLTNAAQTFQRLMDSVCQGLQNVFVYLDDVLIASQDQEQHLADLRTLFSRFREHGLVINPTKCQFGRSTLDFLGHRVSASGIKPLPEKVEVIRNFPAPRTVKQLMEFNGMVNFYHRFLPSAAEIMQPLYRATAGRKSKTQTVQWSTDMTTAFNATKAALAKATLLVHPKTDAPTALTVDASDVAVGGVLQQKLGSVWKPLAFFSRQLNNAERKYSAFDRELLAIHLSIRKFRYFLEGRHFTVYTDHKPLTFAMAKKSVPWSARQSRQLAAISEYTTDIRHVSGKSNSVADTLSRATVNAIDDGLDFQAMAREQTDLDLRDTSLELQRIPFDGGRSTLLCDVSTGTPRPVVPPSWRRRVFDAVHTLSHPGIRTTKNLVSAKYVWKGLAKDVNQWSRSCIACQQSKVTQHTKTALETFRVPERRFSHLNIDLVGPLPHSRGYTYLLTIVDRFTRWPEAIPISDISAAGCARALLYNWVARFGVPADMSSDRGPQFTSRLWDAVCELLGTKLHRTTSYHPQANGLVERFHRSMKAALRARCTHPGWVDELPWVLLGLRTTPKADLGSTSAELVYGETIAVPADFMATPETVTNYNPLLNRLRETAGSLRPTPTSSHGNTSAHVTSDLSNSKFVFVRRGAHGHPLTRPYDGPYEVISPGEKVFRLRIGLREELVSADRLKPAYIDKEHPFVAAQPPTRGRPPLRDRSIPSPDHEQRSPESSQREQDDTTYTCNKQMKTRFGRMINVPPRFRA